MNKLHNFYIAIKDQLPYKRLIKNIFNGNILGWISKYSHYKRDGTEKISYNSKITALKTAKSMAKKYGHTYSYYKCLYCDGYHVGKKYNQQ